MKKTNISILRNRSYQFFPLNVWGTVPWAVPFGDWRARTQNRTLSVWLKQLWGGLLLNQRFRDHATTWLYRNRNWCRNPENTAETVHSRWALLEVCWYPGHHDGYHRHNEERSKGHTDESSNFQVLHQRRSLAWSRWRLRPEISAKHFSENKTRKTYKT